jgi:hypothetical protein
VSIARRAAPGRRRGGGRLLSWALALAVLGSGACSASPAPHPPTSPGSPRADGSAPPSSTPTPSAGATAGPGGCRIAEPASPPTGATFFVCFAMTGEVNGVGGFVDQALNAAAESCAQWAAGGGQPPGTGGDVLVLPDPGDAGVTVQGQPVSFYLLIGAYAGPGTYTLSTQVTESGTWGLSTSWSTNATRAATFSAEVNADGSGTVTATALHNDSSDGRTETITETWTCVDEPVPGG